MPTEKKSTSRANASACSATAGTSTITPTSIVGPPTRLVERARRAVLVERRDHREHDAAPGARRRRRAIARSWVRRSSGLREPEPDAADAEERVVLGRLGAGTRSGLSAPASSVRTISGRPSSASAISLVDRALLVLGRRGVAVEEQELGAQQADAVGAELDRAGRPRRRGRRWRRPRSSAPSRSAWRARAPAREPRAWRSSAGLAARSRSASTSSRAASTSTVPASPSTHERRALRRSPSTASPRPTTAGIPSARARIAACDVAPPRAIAEPLDELAVEPRRVAGREVARDEHARLGDARRRGLAGQVAQHAPADVVDVDRPLAQVRVVEPAVRRRGRRARPRSTPPRRSRPPSIASLRRAEQRGVVEQQQVRVEDRGLGLAGLLRRSAPARPRRRARAASRAASSRAHSVRRVAQRASSATSAPRRAGAAAPGRSRCPARRGRDARRPWRRETPLQSGAARRAARGRGGRGGGGRWRRRVAVLVAEVVVGQLAQRGERGVGVGPAGADARSSWPWRTPSVISAVRLRASAGPRPVVSSATVIGGVEAGGGLDEARGRAGVEAERVRHVDAQLRRRPPATRPGAAGASGPRRRAARPSCRAPTRASAATSSSVRAGARARGGGDRALDQRRLAQQDLGPSPSRSSRPPSRRS